METTRICPGCKKPLPAEAPQGLCPECLLKAGLGSGVDLGAETQTPSRRIPFTAPTGAELAGRFPSLEILAFIGQGGMGAVYKARQKQLDRVVALKILPPDIGKDPAFAERFTREARALAKLSHPGVVTLFEFGEADGLFFFLMEFVDGVNLRQLLDRGRLSPREALAIVPQICDALQYAHDQGIVHRDIKPENILLDRQGRVKVADFGLAKLMGREGESGGGLGILGAQAVALTEVGKIMGTPSYMAPEQMEHPQEVDHRADIYSLGVVFYQMLTGELPGRRLEPPSARASGLRLDVRLDEVVLHALEKEPERRYQQASQIKTAVEIIANTPPTIPPNATAQDSPRNTPLPFGRAVGSAIAVFLLVVVAAGIITFSMPDSYVSSVRVMLVNPRQAGDFTATLLDPYLVQTESEVMRSSRVLTNVIARLELTQSWGSRFARGTTLTTGEALDLLRRSMAVRQLPRTSILEIQVFSPSRDEAAEIANAIATCYAALPSRLVEARILENARPALRPARPNKPLNLAVGGIIGLVLGLITAGSVLLFTLVKRPQPPAAKVHVEAKPPSPSRRGTAQVALGLFLAALLGTLVLMTLSFRHDLALIFGGTSLVLGLMFGIASWRERLGKVVVLGILGLCLAGAAALVILA